MTNNFYFYEDIVALGQPTFTDSDGGNDWLALSQDYGGTLVDPGAFLILSNFKYSSKPGSVDFAFAFSLPQGLSSAQVFGGIENAMGGAGSEVIFGSDLANVLQGDPDDVAGGSDAINGFGGADTLFGMGGDDILQGGNDNDLMFGDGDPFAQQGNLAPGNDNLIGGLGNDTLFGGAGTNILNGGEGYDTADYSGFFDDFGNYSYRIVTNLVAGTTTVYAFDLIEQTETVIATDTLIGIDVVIGSPGNDLIEARFEFGPSDFGGSFLYGGAGRDTLWGGPGVDALYGGDGDDVLSDFADQTVPRGGVDLMNGGNDNDYYTIFYADTLIIEGATQGFDHVVSAVSYTLPTNIEKLTLAPFMSTALNGIGNASDNFLEGNLFANDLDGLSGNDYAMGMAENDILRGGVGNDSLLGGTEDDALLGGSENDMLAGEAGSDRLFGGTGNDQLFGGGQGDRLLGGAGRDILNGGGSADIFVFQSRNDSPNGSQRDVIKDFTSKQDMIDLHRIAKDMVFTTAPGFVADGTAQVRYDSVTGILAGDSDGNGAVDWQISLGAGTVLVANDLIL
ncbi:MAG: M10 family metallopeptidase C-terminal domain-containing protein [Candidatus Saccharibacteria bacterium]|nr:M10 family metallopeptidase C-terminal domain-containing protein [Pseudorhodobacter sp.]